MVKSQQRPERKKYTCIFLIVDVFSREFFMLIILLNNETQFSDFLHIEYDEYLS
jgi:hypothetical protein